jgi:isocitrate lyase
MVAFYQYVSFNTKTLLFIKQAISRFELTSSQMAYTFKFQIITYKAMYIMPILLWSLFPQNPRVVSILKDLGHCSADFLMIS